MIKRPETKSMYFANCIYLVDYVYICIYRYLLNKVKDMQELVKMSQNQLEQILGSDIYAVMLNCYGSSFILI